MTTDVSMIPEQITRTFYDALRRVIAVRDPLGRTITQQWCGCGTLDKLIDAKGQSTVWERDIQGRVTRETRADGTTHTDYVYETTTSRLKTVTDPKSQVTTYTYSLDDKLLQMAFTNEAIATPDVTFTYETSYPRLSTMVDGIGTTTYSYKAPGTAGAGRLATVDGPLTDDTITMTYDDIGRITARLVNGYGVSSLEYDSLGRLTEETNELGTFTYAYQGIADRLDSVAYPNGQTSTFSYFGNSGDRRIQTIHHKTSSGATLSKLDYTYSPVGNIVTWRKQAGTEAVLWEYTHDAAAQLARAVKKSTAATPTILKRYAYTYDMAGNRTTEQIDNVVVGASYDNLNRLTSQQSAGVVRVAGTVNETAKVTVQGQPATVSSTNEFEGIATIPAGTSTLNVSATDTNNNTVSNTYEISNSGTTNAFTYDANGNMTSDGSRTFEWDARNRLLSVTIGTHRSEFTYDGRDRRVRVVEKESGTTQSDDRLVWCDSQVCETRAANGITVTKRAFLLGEQVSGVSLFITLDHLGSPVDEVDSMGALVDRYDFDPLGRRSQSGTPSSGVGYTGHYWHQPSSLELAHRREYDPALARWLSEDPLGLAAGLNRFRYVGNSPLRFVDPTGTVAMNVVGPTYHRVGDWNTLTSACGGRGGFAILGCTRSRISITCDCRLDGSCWVPSIAIMGTMNVYILDNPLAKADAETIRREENKHVEAIFTILNTLKNQAEVLERQKFQYRLACELVCLQFELSGTMDLLLSSYKVHKSKPHPY